jgi:hypothetical protein
MTAPWSFAGKVARETTLVYDLRVTLGEQPCFFILRVHPAKQRALLAALQEKRGLDLETFGTILHRGKGEPPQELKFALQQEFGLYS